MNESGEPTKESIKIKLSDCSIETLHTLLNRIKKQSTENINPNFVKLIETEINLRENKI